MYINKKLSKEIIIIENNKRIHWTTMATENERTKNTKSIQIEYESHIVYRYEIPNWKLNEWMNENWIAPTDIFTWRKHIEHSSSICKNTFNSNQKSSDWMREKNVNKCSALNLWTGILAFIIFAGKIQWLKCAKIFPSSIEWRKLAAFFWLYFDKSVPIHSHSNSVRCISVDDTKLLNVISSILFNFWNVLSISLYRSFVARIYFWNHFWV